MVLSRTLVLSLLCAAAASAQGIHNRNLVVNGDAEAGPAAPSVSQTVASVPGWKTYGGFTVVPYGVDSTIGPNEPGPKHRGKNFFIGGPGSSRSYAEQTVSLAGAAPGAKFYLSAFMGRNYGNPDPKDMSLKATFIDDKGATIQEVTLGGPVLDVDYTGAAGLLPRPVSGFLLPGVAQVKLTLDFGTVSGSDLNGLIADNVSLILAREPLTGTDLIINGDAEVDPEAPVPDWNGPYQDLTPEAFDDVASYRRLGVTSPGPANRGRNYFFFNIGASPGKVIRYWQIVEVSRAPYLTVIDAGQMRFQLAGWLGVYADFRDEIKLKATFQDGKTPATTLGAAETQTILGTGQTNGLYAVGAGGGEAFLPVGTRRILVEIIITKRSGFGENLAAYADNISLMLTSPPQITIEGVGNAANYVSGKVSPGEIVVVYGTDFGPAAFAPYQLAGGFFTSETGETRVYFDGVPAPMVYSVTGQLSCIVPYSVAGKATTQIQAEYRKFKGNVVTLPVVATVPGLLTIDASGKNQVAALNQDYSINSASKPANKGEVVMLFATGEGQTDPGGTDGKIAAGAYPKPLVPVTAQVNGKDAVVQYYGAAPDLVAGVMQVNVFIPADTPSGVVPITIRIGNDASQSGTTLVVK